MPIRQATSAPVPEGEERYRGITQVRMETRRDRGGPEPKSKRGWRKRENRLRRTEDTQGHGPSTQRTRIDADTGKCKQ